MSQKVTKQCKVNFREYGEIEIPEGLRVTEIKEGSTKGSYFLDQFPANLFPPNSIIKHDAVHYGVVLSKDQVMDRSQQKGMGR